jgi:hypothetical protein
MKKVFKYWCFCGNVRFDLTSCNDDNDYQTVEGVEKVKIDSVKIINDTMDVFTIQSIKTYSCINLIVKAFTAMIIFMMIM